MVDIGRAREALASIPADIARPDWVRVGMAAQAAGLDFDDFDSWSATGSNYDARGSRDTWRSFKSGEGVGAGTLFRMAAELGGYRMRGKSNDLNGHQSRAQPRSKPQAKQPAPMPGNSPADVWARCEAATTLHPYIVKKRAAGVQLDGVRVLPTGDNLRIGGHAMAGALVVPAFGPDGALQSLQLIPPDGPKLNLAGTPMAGASHIVGAGDGPLYMCEGIGTAWACWQATGHRAVVCFGWGNVSRIVTQLREKEPDADMVLVPDAGKEADADKIARENGCMVAKLPEGWANNSDVGDYAQREGLEALQSLLEAAQAPNAPEALLKPVSVADVFSHPAPPPQFIWDGYAPRGVVTLFGAHGGTGKSTVALMLAVSAALGRSLFNVDTEQCNTLFVSLEDGAGIVRHRLAGICGAWCINPQALDGLHIVDGTEHPELYSAESRGAGEPSPAYAELARLVQACGAGLVVVDNASDAFGGDEIQRRQVRAFMRALMALAKENNAAVILLAHVDKNTSRARKAEGGEGYSGSTAWHNSARSRLFMSRAEDGSLTLEHQKSNLGKMREPLTLEWPDGGLPQVVRVNDGAFASRLQGRADDERAAAVLRLIAEFEGRGQYCSPVTTARNNVHALLRSEPAFKSLKMNGDDTRRIVNQCQRAEWLDVASYRTPDRKERQRWTVSPEGRAFAGLAALPAPSAPSSHESAGGAEGAGEGAPSAPSSLGGVGESARAQEGADGGQHD